MSAALSFPSLHQCALCRRNCQLHLFVMQRQRALTFGLSNSRWVSSPWRHRAMRAQARDRAGARGRRAEEIFAGFAEDAGHHRRCVPDTVAPPPSPLPASASPDIGLCRLRLLLKLHATASYKWVMAAVDEPHLRWLSGWVWLSSDWQLAPRQRCFASQLTSPHARTAFVASGGRFCGAQLHGP